MESTVIERSLADVLAESLSAASDELYLLNPTTTAIEELVEVLDDDAPTVRLLAGERTLKSVMDDFLVASSAADHVAAGSLELRTAESSTNTLVVTETAVAALVDTGEQSAALSSDDEAFVESTYERVADRWENADDYPLRTPPLSRVRSTLAEIGGPGALGLDRVGVVQ